ncbi:MAG: electron carrier [Claussenomyces sp. TS43310]|nr:MAG: electron carrier [Claussenomyces sp. TS43310]
MSYGGAQRTLLLAPPSVATQEDTLRDVFRPFDRSTTDLQMLDRLFAGVVPLPSNTYDCVLVLADTDGAPPSEPPRLLNRNVYTALVSSMKAGAILQLQGGSLDTDEAREAILAGLVEKDGVFQKLHDDDTVAIPLRRGAKKSSARTRKDTSILNLDNALENDDDELIDENTLLSEEDLRWRPQQPVECRPKPGRRRRACKDCTCGLAAELEAEDKAQRTEADTTLNVLKLQSDDLFESDFTVPGKTGSCGNCSLGDAFRCTSCPYIGLPAFKPGEEVRLLNDMVQL